MKKLSLVLVTVMTFACSGEVQPDKMFAYNLAASHAKQYLKSPSTAQQPPLMVKNAQKKLV